MATWCFQGDQDYKRECLSLANVGSNTPCSHCPANTSTCPWYDFRPTAEWVKNIYTPNQFRASQWCSCLLLKIPLVSCDTIYPDWMHDKNLGTDKVKASCLKRKRTHCNQICLQGHIYSPKNIGFHFLAP